MNYRTLAIAAFVALALVGSSWAYTSWAGGSVVCSVSGEGGYTFKIRQIPLEPPALNDGYAYRCEVWDRRILVQASTYTQDSWTARHFSITKRAGSVIFDLDGYEIVGPYPGISTPDGDWCGEGHK